MTEIYRKENENRSLTLIRLTVSALAVLSAAALFICVRLCAGVNVLNENRTRLVTTLVSAAAGWIVISALDLIVFPLRAERRHALRIMEAPSVMVSGEIVRISPPRHIRGSIDIREIILRTDTGDERLLVSRKRAAGLPPAGSCAAFRVCDGYVAAFEVRHE